MPDYSELHLSPVCLANYLLLQSMLRLAFRVSIWNLSTIALL